jgi:GT2 family glycosyltransferase/uncharacterized coiled-coil protein SlyX
MAEYARGRAVSERETGGRGSFDHSGSAEERIAELKAELQRRSKQVERLEVAVASHQRDVARMQGTLTWQLATRAWRLRDRVLAKSPILSRSWRAVMPRVRQILRRHVPDVAPVAGEHASYDEWIARNTPTLAELASLREQAAALAAPPLFSVVVPVHDVAESLLRRCIDSVRAQAWERWTLCAVDDGSRAPHIWPVLEAYAREDPRIHVARSPDSGGIVAATQRALALAGGDFVAFLDHDDELAPEALLAVAAKLGGDPALDLVYSDEDKLDERGRRIEPFFKPEWSPDLLLSMNYVSHLTVVRRTLLEAVGGLRPGFDGSQDYDLVLRLVERTQRIGHVPRVLYHWRQVPGSASVTADAKPYAVESAWRALEEALVRRGTPGRIGSRRKGIYDAHYAVFGQPLVSIVMPTRDHATVLRTCVRSIESSTTWPRWDLTVVDNGSVDGEALAYLEELKHCHRVVRDARPFNWSALNNGAVRGAKGEYLLFMNNDMEVIGAEWMEMMLEHAQRPEVGAVGARLLYPDGSVQHAGVVLGIGGAANHAFRRLPREDPGYFGLAQVVRNVSAVTGACMMVRREVFDQMGGFDERLPVAFNDIDFCLKLRKAGYLIVYTPFAELYHHESATRRSLHPPEDEALLRNRWCEELLDDPYYSPNLTRGREDFSIRT